MEMMFLHILIILYISIWLSFTFMSYISYGSTLIYTCEHVPIVGAPPFIPIHYVKRGFSIHIQLG